MSNFCQNCGEANVAEAKFCANCGELLTSTSQEAAKEGVPFSKQTEAETKTKESKTLYRSRTQKIFSGISAGLGQYFGVSTGLVRLFWIITFFLTSGTSLVWYIVLAAVTPLEPLEGEKASVLNAGKRAASA